METVNLDKKIKKTKTRKSKQKSNYSNNYIYGFIFIITSILLEICNFVRFGLGILPTNFGIELSIILIMAGIIFLVPSKPAKITIMSIILGVQFIMNIANASLYKMMYDIITVDMIFTLGFETADAFELNQLDLLAILFQFIILAIYILAIIFGNKYAKKVKMAKNKKTVVFMLLMFVCGQLINIGALNMFEYNYYNNVQAEYIFEDNKYLNTSLDVKFASMKKYGFWSFYINNASIFFNYKKNISDNEFTELKNYLNENKDYEYKNSMYNGQNVSGALKGDNLIVIMMESIEWFAIDPINTPTLYTFIENDSVKFENFCARNKTNLSEEISMLGSIVNDYSFTTINNNVGINVPNSLPNLIKQEGYESVNFFHDYTGEMYDRNTLNKKIGFENVYTMKECPIDNKSKYFGDFLDDGDFIKAYSDTFMPSDKSFFSFFTTVTTHGPYEKSNKRYTEYYEAFDKNYEEYCNYVIDNDLNYYLPKVNTKKYKILKEYKSKAMAMENCIKVILNHLNTNFDSNGAPLIDNTSIVMYTDHNAYYSNLCYFVKGLDQYANDNDLYNIPFVIYNKDLPASKVQTFCNTYDIFPTICDLYGLKFNTGLTQGYSVFSEQIKDSVFVSTMCGIFDDNYYTVTLDDFVAQDTSKESDQLLLEFKQKANKFLTKQDMIEKYYRINYEDKILKQT